MKSLNTTLLIIFAILLILVVSKKGETNEIIEQVETSVLKQHLIDSINSVRFKEKDSILTAKSNEFDIKYNTLLSKYSKAKKKDSEIIEIYNNNDSLQTDICDTIIKIKDRIINYQDSMIINRDSLNNVKDTLIFEAKLLLSSKDTTIQNLSINNSILIKEIKKDNTWFKRNEKWIYFAGGAIGILLIK